MLVSKLKVGVVGVGMAGHIHLSALKNIKNVQIQALCDARREAVYLAAHEYKVPTHYTDFTSMLKKEKLDFITICTPPSTHSRLCIEAIESGVHALVEKPFTETTREAMDVLEALKRTGDDTKVGVVHNDIFSHVVRKGRRIFKRGEIGRLLNLLIVVTYPFDSDPFFTNKEHWSHKIPGGRVCEALPHPVYLVQEFTDNVFIRDIQARKLCSSPWVSFDGVKITLQSDSAFGSIYWSRNAPKNEYMIYLIGSEGTLKMNLFTGSLVNIRHKGVSEDITASMYRKKVVQIRYTLSEIRQLLTSLFSYHGRVFLRVLGVKRAFLLPHEACIRSFVDSIITDQQPYVDAQKGYDCVRLTEEISKYLEEIRLENPGK